VTPYKTKGGAQVLKPKKAEIAAAINSIFDTPPMEETSAQPIAGCRAKPTPKPPPPSATITATLTLTPTLPN